MKNIIISTLIFLFCLLGKLTIVAQDTVVINNLRYVINPNYHEAILIPKDEGYSGIVKIPAILTIDYEPFKVTTIEKGTFANCSGLKEVIIPESVKIINKDAFIDVPNGLKIYINSSHPPKAHSAFDNNSFETTSVFFSTEGIKYRFTKILPWSNFKNTGIIPKDKSDGIDRRTDSEKRKVKVTRL